MHAITLSQDILLAALIETQHIYCRMCDCNERLEEADREILWDPQTSGGLFAAIKPALWPEIHSIGPRSDVLAHWRGY